MKTAVSSFTLPEVKELIDVRLADYCKVRIATAQQINERYVVLWDTINTLLQAGGKRLRPYILLGAFDAYAPEGDIEGILSAALAQELIHVAMLVHDDIIDRDTIRYGIKNVNGQYDDHYTPFIQDVTERTHMTQSSALLAGDLLLSDAYRLLSRVDRPQEMVSKAISILSTGVFEVVGGELLDTESAFLPKGTISAHSVARYKTASYSFISPLTMGATLAGASDEQIGYLHTFGEIVGTAYQFRDDLLGVFGDENETGKSTSNDIREGKQTFLVEQFMSCATEKQKEQFFAIFHRADTTEDEIIKARALLLESGAKARVEEKISDLADQAQGIINELDISSASKETFQELLELCLTRNK